MRAIETYKTIKTGLFQDETLFLYCYIAHNGLKYETTGDTLIYAENHGIYGSAICPPLLPDTAKLLAVGRPLKG